MSVVWMGLLGLCDFHYRWVSFDVFVLVKTYMFIMPTGWTQYVVYRPCVRIQKIGKGSIYSLKEILLGKIYFADDEKVMSSTWP